MTKNFVTKPLLFAHDSAIVVRNIVATVNLEVRLDLKTIALHARNAEYNPKVLNCTALS